jgi:hypothetical protein
MTTAALNQYAEPVMGVAKYPLPPELKIVWYSTPEEAYGKMWEPAAQEEDMTVDELVAASAFMGIDQNGKDIELSSEDAFAGMHALGCWGWVDTDLNIIHAWSSPDADPAMVMHFLAHEIAHATGTADDDDFQEEMRAEQYGHVARLAFKLFSDRNPRAQPPAPVFRDLSTPVDPQISAYELFMSATPLTTEEVERMERMRLALQIDQSVFETIGEAHCPKPDSIPETATISNINLICPPGVNQTEFAGGWNDSRQFALTHGTVPPVIKGIDARAQGWNACSGRMTLCEANQNGC